MIEVVNNAYTARKFLEERAAMMPAAARLRKAIALTLEELDKAEAVKPEGKLCTVENCQRRRRHQ